MGAPSYRVAVVGLGYFSRFHLDAWEAAPTAELVGICDQNANQLLNANVADPIIRDTSWDRVLQETDPDILDIVAPPPAHAALIRAALGANRTIICQKPFCTSIDEARSVIAEAAAAGTRIVIHENFRFQPWYRDLRDVLGQGLMGTVYQARFDLRPGDGRGARAYLDRQPAFQSMPRLLIHETGVHFVDLFRWLFGDIISVYAELRRLNPVVAGEDAGVLMLEHASGVRTVFDGNRLSDHATDNPRRTMGEMVIEGEAGCLTLTGDGVWSFRAFGSHVMDELPAKHAVDEGSFGGGCVGALIDHVLASLGAGREPENLARDYLHVMEATEAAYAAAENGRRITL